MPRSSAEVREEERARSVTAYAENARAWWESGRRYYVVRLSLGGTVASMTRQQTQLGDDVPGILEAIEAAGWRLHHIGYVYQPLRERSHALTDSALMTGDVLGIYTFSRPGGAAPPALPG